MAGFVERHGVCIGAMVDGIAISMNKVHDSIRDLSTDYDVDMAAKGDGETGRDWRSSRAIPSSSTERLPRRTRLKGPKGSCEATLLRSQSRYCLPIDF